jgi:hypothetical protein
MRDYTKDLIDDNRGSTMIGRLMASIAIMLVIAFIALLYFALSASAEGRDWSVSAEAGANAESNVSVNTGAAAFGGGASITEQQQAPALGGLALGGGNPCAWSPATAQISMLGGGAGIGGMKIDEACSLVVLGVASGDQRAFKAAGLVIAGRNPEACAAMEQAGMIDCVSGEDRRITKSSLAASTKDNSGGKCKLVGKKLSFRVSSGGDRDGELAACKAKYGLR